MLDIAPALREKLKKVRAKQLTQQSYHDEVFAEQDVVILTLGLGPAMYLHLDGYVIIWDSEAMWSDNKHPIKTKDIKEIAGAIVVGAKRLDMPELLELLPPPPRSASICPQCSGKRTMDFGSTPEHWIVCPRCNGLAWIK